MSKPMTVQRMMLDVLNFDLADAQADCRQFFSRVLFTHRPHVTSVRQIGRYLSVLPGTLMSRFYRAGLPSPKQYIDISRLVRAARLLENVGLSISAVARQLDYSSPQAFSRHIRCLCLMSAVEFRQKFTGDMMLQRFREKLILPYLDILRVFHPIAVDPGWIPKANLQKRKSEHDKRKCQLSPYLVFGGKISSRIMS